ncbi:MAG: LamG-like jellyroll fold domain-containing protein, partial [Phycisphaerales bacterium]
TTTEDSSGNGNNGTLEGPVWVEGVFDGALQFTGDDRVNCGEATNLGLTQALSLALWVNPADFTGDRAFAGRAAAGVGYAFKSQSTHLRFTTPGVLDHDGNNSILTLNTWQHVAVTFSPGQTGGCVFYINGVATDTLTASALTSGAGPFEIGHNFWGQWCNGMIDDVRLYNHVLTLEEVQASMVAVSPGLAGEPNPEDEATDVPADAALAWTPGESAVTHDVYLGTNFDDVNDASVSDPRGVLVGQGLAEAAYASDSPFEYGQTYYWRVDEVNGAPDYTVFKGEVWSFTAETYGYPITSLTVEASNAQLTSPASNTINGSGLDEFDQHGVDLKTMWATSGGLPAWIQYTFDKVYKLHELWVWNANSELEVFMGFGAKDVVIEYSTDGETWAQLENVPEFAKGTGTATYTANTIVDFGGVMAKYVKLTINDNWGATALVSLSEVRFFYTPAQAFEPDPADGATGVELGTTLNWRPGREATSHEVSFGTDPNALTAETVADHNYTPASMDFGTLYYWRVDEVGEAGTYAGDVWSFRAQEFGPIDDFESYNDDIEAETTIWHAWVDGVTTQASGSQVGYTNSPFAETKIVHSGKQSMPFMYDNATSFFFSEAEREFESAQNWTGNGADEVALWVQGNAAKFVETAPGQYTISSNTADIWGTSDNFRFVYKQLNGDGAISAKVLSITGGSATWAKPGVMIRESLDPAASYALMHPTPDGRRAFQNRPTTGANAVSAHSGIGAITLPIWVKVERKGNQFTAYYSQDGTTWTKQPDTENTGTDRSPNPQTIGMGNSAYIGLAVTSNNAAGGFCFAEFSDVVTTGGATGDWTVADIGDNPGNDPAPMYVTLADSAGKSATATNADIVTSVDWTRWVIPMSDFAGVNFAKVKKMVITIGDKTATKAGGTGIVFIDDIGFGHSAE